MTAHENCFVLLDQESLEPLQRGDVQVVGRLVEKEQVGVVEQEAGETETRSLATGERCDLAIAKHVETKPTEHPTEGRLEVVAASVFELMLYLGIPLE